MSENIFAQTTRKASTTFYLASLLFPPDIRNDVFILYSFVRIADDFIDQDHSDMQSFLKYRQMTKNAFLKKPVENEFIQAFAQLVERKKINKEYVEEFFRIQMQDSIKKTYKNFEELEEFLYGVAEVIGLMMSQIMELKKEAYDSARKLGRAMQLLNIIRDISEDADLGRTYIPETDLIKFGINGQIIKQINRQKMTGLIRFELDRINDLIKQAQAGFCYIPNKYLLPVAVSADLYRQILRIIYSDPMIVFDKKVKPAKLRIIFTIIRHLIMKLLKIGFYKNNI